MNEIYLDNGATTKVSTKVVEAVVNAMEVDFGNTSSLHYKGMAAENIIKEAREVIASNMGVDEQDVIFTSGGSESNNMAIKGACEAYKRNGKHIITTVMEHKAIVNPIKYIAEKEDYEVTYLSIKEDGSIDLDELAQAVREDTLLVSIMHVNNEVGAIQDLEKIAKVIKEKNPRTLFHSDGIQAFGKVPLHLKKWGVDLYSISAHKFHGPKGVGALYVKKNTRLVPLIHGGGHQRDFRSGTENTPGVAGMGAAAKEACNHMTEAGEKMRELKRYFFEELVKRVGDVTLNGPTIEKGAPHLLSIRIKNVRGEVLLHSLESEKIYISTGSACASNKPEEKSPTLNALGLDRVAIDECVRISFSKNNTKEEVDRALETFESIIPKLRLFTLGGRRK